jgi:hypothetical protein
MEQKDRIAKATATVDLVLECLNKGTGNITGKGEANQAREDRNSIIKQFRAEDTRHKTLKKEQGDPLTSVEAILFRAALAMSTQVGNCYEHACMAFTHLWHQDYPREDALDIMAAVMNELSEKTDEHVFLVMGCPDPLPKNCRQDDFLHEMAEQQKYCDTIVICDSWFHLRQLSLDGPDQGGVYTPKKYYERTVKKTGRYSKPFLIDNVRSLFRIAPS